MRMALVIWQDASECDVGPWVDRGTAEEPQEIIFHQVGFIYSLTPAALVLTSCVGEHQMSTRTRIPTGMVRSITELVSGAVIALPKRRRK